MRILLVEDDRSIAESVVEGLVANAFVVTHVSTGADALAAADHDLILLDLGLPDMDGRDVCRQLRKRTQVPITLAAAVRPVLDDQGQPMNEEGQKYLVIAGTPAIYAAAVQACNKTMLATGTGVRDNPLSGTFTVDAADVPITQTFGPNTLVSFKVWTDEIVEPALTKRAVALMIKRTPGIRGHHGNIPL